MPSSVAPGSQRALGQERSGASSGPRSEALLELLIELGDALEAGLLAQLGKLDRQGDQAEYLRPDLLEHQGRAVTTLIEVCQLAEHRALDRIVDSCCIAIAELDPVEHNLELRHFALLHGGRFGR